MEPERHRSLQALMIRLAEGDRAAFEPTFDLLWPIVRRFAERALGGAPEAEDAAQDALVKVFTRATQFDGTRSALPWVLSVAAYECKTYRQRLRRSKLTQTEQTDVPSRAPSPEQQAIERDLLAALHEAIQALGPSDAITLQAVLEEQPSAVVPATFRKRLSRALARLRITWMSRHGID